MRVKSFSIFFGLMMVAGNGFAADPVFFGVGEHLRAAPSGEVGVLVRARLGSMVEKLNGGGQYARPGNCMQGNVSETISANNARVSFDDAAHVEVARTSVNIVFRHHTPFKKTLTLVNEVFQPNGDEDCFYDAYLKSMTLAPYYYLGLVVRLKIPSGSEVEPEAFNQQLKNRIAEDSFFQSIRLRDFAESSYIEQIKERATNHGIAVGLLADGWTSIRSLFGPSDMGSAISSCTSGFYPTNSGRDKCLELTQMVGTTLDASFPESSANEYHENNGGMLTRSTVIDAVMSETLMPPQPN